MRSPHIVGLGLALCLLGTPALAQKGKPPAHKDTEAEYKALMQGFRSAQEKYYEPYEKAKTDAERERIRLDSRKDPARLYIRRFQSLSKRAHGSETGANALLEVMHLATQTRELDTAIHAVNDLLADYSRSPMIAQAAGEITQWQWSIGLDKTEQMLQKIVNRSPDRTNKAAALYNIASLYAESGQATAAQKASAKSLFVKLSSDYTDTRYAKYASGYLYQMEHLQIGMTAPDFEATDEADQKFKLSDYRGKVVVLDFWGFW